jgi:hypothetical protein
MPAAVCCFVWLGQAHGSTLAGSILALSVSAGSDTVDFPLVFDTLSWSTGSFTVGDYTISNITEEFVGLGFPTISDPMMFRLTGIGSVTCTVCVDPLEIDFAAGVLPDSDDDFVFGVTIGMDGSLGPGNDVPTELAILFSDGSFFDQVLTLNASSPFNQKTFFGAVGGPPLMEGGFLLGCGCTNLAPGQVFSAPDSISVTFDTPEPGTGMLLATALTGLLAAAGKRTLGQHLRNHVAAEVGELLVPSVVQEPQTVLIETQQV